MRILHLLIKLLVFLSAIILVAAGHAAVPLLFLEVFLFALPFDPDTYNSGLENNLLFIAILAALVGHILLLVSIKMKRIFTKVILIITGEFFLLSGIILLCRDFRSDAGAMFTLQWSLPALIMLLVLSLYLIFGKKYW